MVLKMGRNYSNKQHILPGGSSGRRLIYVLADEVQQLAVGNVSSEDDSVFSSVVC